MKIAIKPPTKKNKNQLVIKTESKSPIKKNIKQVDVCWYESNTKICGKLKHVDYFEILESKMIFEPYYGDIDLFGF